jgi:hypothetical protein
MTRYEKIVLSTIRFLCMTQFPTHYHANFMQFLAVAVGLKMSSFGTEIS